MGSRANYVLIDERGWTLRYSHWGAAGIDRDLIWGPDHARDFILAQDETDEWLDEVWCEGGALVDLPRRSLLFFGGEDAVFDAALQRLELAIFERLWPGWSVGWAREGLGDLVDYLGLDRALVRSGRAERAPGRVGLRPPRPEGLWSVRGLDGSLRLYLLDANATEISFWTPEVLEDLARLDSEPSLRVHVSGEAATRDGVHLDLAAKTIDLWTPSPEQDLAARVATRWPGWRFTHHGPRWEAQSELASDALEWILPSRASLEAELTARLTRGGGLDPVKIHQDVLRANPGREIVVNPEILTHVAVELAPMTRAEALERALRETPILDGFAP